jgi:hypothetical protein
MGKNNRLNHEQAYKLNCWVVENHSKHEHLLQDEISEQASKELGFTVKTSNDLTSYTQRGVQNFEINEDIICTPFADRFDNGLAGWTAEFTLTTHNDKNRCLFFLIPVEGEQGFIIEDCLTSQRYKAILDPGQYSSTIGGVFSTLKSPGLSNTYANLVCYTIVEPIAADDWDFVNLPILQPGIIQTCTLCNLWINPKVWSTTPAAWSGADAEFRTWSTV